MTEENIQAHLNDCSQHSSEFICRECRISCSTCTSILQFKKTLFILFLQIHETPYQGWIQDLIGGGPQIVTGLKLPFWGLSFVEFWCWGLIFGGQGGLAPWGPPGSTPALPKLLIPIFKEFKERPMMEETDKKIKNVRNTCIKQVP